MRRSAGAFAVMVPAQMISLLGSEMSSFALSIWLFRQTGRVSINGALLAAMMAPEILLSPVAGVLVDRHDRGRILLAGQLGAGLCSLAMLLAYRAGHLFPSLAIALVALASLARAAERPAFASSVSLLVPRAQLGRANGLVQLTTALAQIAAPVLSGFLLPLVRLDGIFAIDLTSFVCAVIVFSILRLPRPEAASTKDSLWRQIPIGFRWVRARAGLWRLLMFFAASNLVITASSVVITPLILGFANERALGMVFGIGGLGMLAGSLGMMVTGGPRRRIYGVVCGGLLQGVLLLLGAARPSLMLAGAGIFGAMIAFPVMNASSETIWQRKVPPELQGRVFSFRYFCSRMMIPVASVGAGPLADWFEPMLQPGGALAGGLGRFIGVGRGRGSGLLLALFGVVAMAVAVLGLLSPRLRRVESELPDHDAHDRDAQAGPDAIGGDEAALGTA